MSDSRPSMESRARAARERISRLEPVRSQNAKEIGWPPEERRRRRDARAKSAARRGLSLWGMEVTHRGYVRMPNGTYQSEALPALELGYSLPTRAPKTLAFDRTTLEDVDVKTIGSERSGWISTVRGCPGS